MIKSASERKTITREELNSLLDEAADIIRTATDYKFILVLLFFKRVSDTWKEEFELKKRELLNIKTITQEEAEAEAEKEVWHSFNLRKELLWDIATMDVVKLPENLSNALIKTAELNKELKGVIDKFSFLGFTTQEHKEKLRQLIELFNRYSFGNQNVSGDIVGDAYEHILYRFAPNQAKQGEVYTPREVIQLTVNILDPRPLESVYDPACGSGGMLIESYKYVRERYGKEEKLLLYGQEYNSDIYGLCRLNLIAHGLRDVFIEYGDSLLYPRFVDEGKLKQFDVVLANPPWNQDGYTEDILKKGDFKDRFVYGYSNASSADLTWVEHMLASAKPSGRIGIVIDNGCLFRGGAERSIREKIIKEDLVECVILLPEKLFYNTGAPGAIIILNKRRQSTHKGTVLFINSSNENIPHPSIRRLNTLSNHNIEKITSAFLSFSNVEGFAKLVPNNEIAENDYNLNVPLYVIPVENKTIIEIGKEYSELVELENQREVLRNAISSVLKEYLKER